MPDMPDMSSRLLLMSGRELTPCRIFCPAGFNTQRMSDKQTKNDHCYLPVINWENCLTGVQNVWQIVEDKIIFAITGFSLQTANRRVVCILGVLALWGAKTIIYGAIINHKLWP